MKTFYIVSALTEQSMARLCEREHYATEALAIERATEIVNKRYREGQNEMHFYVLKAVASVGPEQPPVTVTKLK